MGYTLEEILNTPTIIIDQTLNDIDKELTNGVVSREATTPFHMLMESSRTLAKDSLLGTQSIIRRKFPNLASSSADIFLHIHSDLKDNLFAIPGTAPIVFYVNVLDLKQYGIEVNNGYKMTIPKTTVIEVRGTIFTLLNDIEITLKDNNNITIEQINNELDIAVNDIGILNSGIYTDIETVEWIVFETNVKNITKTSQTLPITVTSNFNKLITLTNKFSSINVSYNDGNSTKPMAISYSDEYLDDKTPTAIISLTDTTVNVYIPDIYLLDGTVNGELTIDVYETNGNLYLPLNQLTAAEYTVTLLGTNVNDYTAVSSNVTILCNSRSILNNGVDNMTFEELKASVINSTLGDIDIPISDLQIRRKATMTGYELDLVKDTLFNRLYIASKALPEPDSNLIHSKPDLFFNKTIINLGVDMYNNNVSIYDDIFVIKNGSLFAYDNNGNIHLMSNIDIEAFNNMSKSIKIDYLKSNKVFYTPFTYVVKYNENITTTEVYYLKPSMENIRILNKNFNVLPKVNTKQFGISKTTNGYQILSNIAYNDELMKTDVSKLKARIVLNLFDSTSKLYFDATYNIDTGMFEFNIETGYLNNNLIDLVNGKSLLIDRAVELSNKAYIYIYTTDPLITDSEKFLQTEFNKDFVDNLTILTKESITINFGTKLNYLYNSIYSVYTNRKYQRYDRDIPMFYTEDVYQYYDNGLIFDATVSPSGKVSLTSKLLHKKGDPVLDIDGNQVYEHNLGDIVYDENGEPIIDQFSGIERFLNIMMLEYEYIVAETESYKTYNGLVMDIIYAMVHDDMSNLNNITIDKSVIKYKSFRSIDDVQVDINNVTYNLPFLIKPTITLYINKENEVTTASLIEDFKSRCGKILSKYLNSNSIVLKTIKEEIISNLGSNIKAVGIYNVDPNNSEVINVIGNNRFTIAKKLEVNEANLFTVKYNLELNIQYV